MTVIWFCLMELAATDLVVLARDGESPLHLKSHAIKHCEYTPIAVVRNSRHRNFRLCRQRPFTTTLTYIDINSMNRLFYPHTRDSKSGLGKNKKIVQYESVAPTEDLRSSIPGNWFYNDSSAERIWEEIENDTSQTNINPLQQERSTFQKIDESTHRIRQMIANFEVSDQEFLVGLMDLLDDEQSHMTEETDILLEARFRLSQLIEDHAGNADAQGKMLDSLKYWFTGAIQHSQDSVSDGVGDWIDRNASFDVTSLATMINQSFQIREMSTEQIEELHRSVVDQLTRKIREMGRQIDRQKEKIDELERAVESNTSRRKRQAAKTRDSEQLLSSARRTIYEQEGRIVNLKQAIHELKREVRPVPSTSSGTPVKEEEPEDESRELRELEKDLNFDKKIKKLSDTVTNLKMELNEDMHTIRKMKQNEIALENRIQALERAKKGAEQSLATATEKLKTAEVEHQRKLEEAKKSAAERAVAEAVTQTKLMYEKQIEDIREENRQKVNDVAEKTEKRYKAQMAKMIQAIEDKDQQMALKEMDNRGAEELENAKQQWMSEMNEMKQAYERKISAITRHYEDANLAIMEDRKKFEESTKDDLKQLVENEKMKMEEACSKKLLEYQDKAASDLSEVRKKFMSKVDRLNARIKALEREKQAMQTIIEENELQDELPEQHEVEEDESEDEVLNQSLIELKQREMEKRVSVKFNALLKAQRELFEDQKQWEMEMLAKNLRREAAEAMAKLRSEIMTTICNARDTIANNPDSPHPELVDQLMLDTLSLVGKQDSARDNMTARLDTMPVIEVESRLEALKSKIADLTGENEFLRLTLAELNNGEEVKGDNNEDIIRAMRSSLAEQARKLTDTLKDYDEVKQKLAAIELRASETSFTDVSIQVTPERVLFRLFSKSIFTYFEENHTSRERPVTERSQVSVTVEEEDSPMEEVPFVPPVMPKPKPKQKPTTNVSVGIQTEPKKSPEQLHTDSSNGSSGVDLQTSEEKVTPQLRTHSSTVCSVEPMAVLQTSEEFKPKPEKKKHAAKEVYSPELALSEVAITSVGTSPNCPHCGHEITIDPTIWEVSQTVDPDVECESCHEPVSIPRESFCVQSNVIFSEHIDRVKQIEHDIQQQVHDLIEIKQVMTKGQSTRKPRTAESRTRVKIYSSDAPVRTTSRHEKASQVSSRSFTASDDDRTFTDEQKAEISQREESIDESIQQLIELKTQEKKNELQLSQVNELSVQAAEATAFKKAFILQSLASIDISSRAKLEAVTNTALAISELHEFVPETTQQVALKIVKTAQDLQETGAEPEIVDDLVRSTKNLLLAMDAQTFDIEPTENKETAAIIKENERYKTGMALIREKQNAIASEVKDMRGMTNELKRKHDEIVGILTQSLQKVMSSSSSGEPVGPDAAGALQEQIVYLTKALAEKESEQKNIEELDQLLREREMEMLTIKEDMMKKNSDVECLTQRCGELTSLVEKLQLQLSTAESDLAASKMNSTEQAAELESIVSELKESKLFSNNLRTKLDNSEMRCHELENKLVLKESDNPIEYSIVSPFVVFDTFIEDLPTKGLTLAPANSKSRSPQPERIRVKSGQASPKIFHPNSRFKAVKMRAAPIPASSPPSPPPGLNEMTPLRSDEPLPVVYVTKTCPPSPQNEPQTNAGSYYEHQPITISVVTQKTIQNLRKRLQLMENTLQSKNHELIEIRESHTKLKAMVTKSGVEQQKLERLLRRTTAEKDVLKDKIEGAYEMVTRRDEEIKELRRLIREIMESQGSTVVHAMIDKFAKDQGNAVTMRQFRYQALVNDIRSTYSVSPFLKRLAERQMAAVARWEARRNEIQERQRRNLIAALEGMNLIKSPQLTPQGTPGRGENGMPRTRTGTLTITHFGPVEWYNTGGTYKRARYESVRPLFDRALVNVNSHHQKVEPVLQEGVVGSPLKK